MKILKIQRGMQCKCKNGHIYNVAVGSIWLSMPDCRECGEPAIAWKGIFEDIDLTPIYDFIMSSN